MENEPFKYEFSIDRLGMFGAVDRVFAGIDFEAETPETYRDLLASCATESDRALVQLVWFVAHTKRGLDIDREVLAKVGDGIWDYFFGGDLNPFNLEWFAEIPQKEGKRELSRRRANQIIADVMWLKKRYVPVTAAMKSVAEHYDVDQKLVEHYWYNDSRTVAYRDRLEASMRDCSQFYRDRGMSGLDPFPKK